MSPGVAFADHDRQDDGIYEMSGYQPVWSCRVERNALVCFAPRPADEWCRDDGSVGGCLPASECFFFFNKNSCL